MALVWNSLVPWFLLAQTLPNVSAVLPNFDGGQVANSLSVDQGNTGQNYYTELVELVSNISGFLAPTGRPARVQDVRAKIIELHPERTNKFSVVASKHKGWPHGVSLVAAGGSQSDVLTPIVSGWVLFHGLGNHTNVAEDPQLQKLTRAVRDSVADSVDVCRSAVSITDVRSINVNLADQSLHIGSASSLLDRTLHTLRWIGSGRPLARPTHMNLTQLKAWYEVRVFDSLRVTQEEIAWRIDALQAYGRFADAGKQLSRSFTRTGVEFGPIIVLDDLGYASRETLWRPNISKDELLDCNEEMLLRSARMFHQYAVAAALFLGAVTACAGSAIFTIKHPSNVPSRLNPLSREA